MILLVSGSRDLTQLPNFTSLGAKPFAAFLSYECDVEVEDITRVYHGASGNTDLMASDFCNTYGVQEKPLPYYAHLGSRGGPVRNKDMIAMATDEARHNRLKVLGLFFFSEGEMCRGTSDCLTQFLAKRKTFPKTA